MKTCPVCRRVYTEETYSFCLEDGSLLTDVYDPQATIGLPPDNSIQTVLASPSDLPPTQLFQPPEPSPPDAVRTLLNHLKDESRTFSKMGRFRYHHEYIWTNGHFFEIAESIPPVLAALFPLKEDAGPGQLVDSLQAQIATTYTPVRGITLSKKEGLVDLFSNKHTVYVNNIYFEYLCGRYPKAFVMTGASAYNPAVFVQDNKLRAGVMGVKT